ncbi:DUF4870 domain-containing protein [Thalassotalea euphylliae]|uniref:DUF4870 domain-containing protein n=1 Tax=Thalassotalea euphylliae TaxID=1655234 RepID=A0A3E0TYH1_9GAMM|nr:hypothetical protein [Thalassotalea euphylliae]REL29514.1 hypothetical protein DXX94_01565 [Thalassotalea euphylliae]
MHLHTSTHTDHDYARMIAFLSYITIVGWLIAIVLYGQNKQGINKRQFTSFHLRQSLGLIITAAVLSFIPLIGWMMNLVVAVFWLISAFYAFKGEYYRVPWLGNEYQNHLRFIT